VPLDLRDTAPPAQATTTIAANTAAPNLARSL